MNKTEMMNVGSESDPKKLWAFIESSIKSTSEALFQIASAIRRLEELGEDVSHLRSKIGSGMLSIYRKVACNQVLPEVVIEFAGIQKLLTKIAALPIPDQKKMADGKPIKVMMHGGDHRLVKPIELSGDDIKQVFGPNGLRSDAEQISYLHDEQRKAAFSSAKSASGVNIVPDKKNKCLLVGEVKIPIRDLMRYVSEIAG